MGIIKKLKNIGTYGLDKSEVKQLNNIVSSYRMNKIRKGSSSSQLHAMNQVVADYIKNKRKK